MDLTVTEETFASLNSYWSHSDSQLNWNSVFVLPAWLEVWWQQFNPPTELFLRAVRHPSGTIGIAPLQVKQHTAHLIGGTDVTDYMDFVAAPGRETAFFETILDHLKQKGILHLDLEHLRPDSATMTHLKGIAESRHYGVKIEPQDVTLEANLPHTWEDYLATLNTKNRHELRRKLRRLSEEGVVNYRFISDRQAVGPAMDRFLKLFVESREDKSAFLTPRMESFFRTMADAMSRIGVLRLGVLELEGQTIAMVFCFDYKDCVYLYNSGFDRSYDYLSAGLLSKAFAIQESIRLGKKRFDFLKGGEVYKYHLGGREVPLYRCQITIK